jgi:hypothetical protein
LQPFDGGTERRILLESPFDHLRCMDYRRVIAAAEAVADDGEGGIVDPAPCVGCRSVLDGPPDRE